MYKFLFTLCFACLSLLFCGKTLTAQCSQPLSLSFIEQQSDAVFKGQVVHQYADWNEDNRIIVTWNQILVKEAIKGTPAQYVYLSTKGGVLNGIGCTVTPSLSLNIGDVGTFYATHFKENFYKPVATQQSFIPTDKKDIILNQKSQQVIVISNISPSNVSGGTSDMMTITGSGFGNLNPPAKVQFRNPDVFLPSVSYQSIDANLILSWSDTEIQLLVPGRDVSNGKSGAGSGEIRIVNESGEILQSSQNIVVNYNKITNNNIEIDLVNDDGNGGYVLTYNNNFSTNASAVASFERAIDSWNCEAQSNLSIATSTTTSNCPTQNEINSIGFDNGCSLPSGTLAETTKWFSICANGITFTTEIDIIFSNTVNWNYGPDATTGSDKDFETLCLHELGHGHGIEHVINEGSTMYPALANSTDIRNIDEQSLAGAADIFEHSTQAINCGGQNPFEVSALCNYEVNVTVLLEGAYENNGLMSTLLGELIPNNQPYSSAPYNHTGTESFTNLPANAVDWVLVEMRSGSPTATPEIGTTVVETVAGLLLSNGNIIDAVTGGLLNFRNLTSGNAYYICVRHRNHLDVLAAQPIVAEAVVNYDFTSSTTKAFGNAQQKWVDGNAVMFVGDYNQDGVIQITDIDLWVAIPALLNTYFDTDGNLDGVVQTTDYDAWFTNKAKVGSDEIGFP